MTLLLMMLSMTPYYILIILKVIVKKKKTCVLRTQKNSSLCNSIECRLKETHTHEKMMLSLWTLQDICLSKRTMYNTYLYTYKTHFCPVIRHDELGDELSSSLNFHKSNHSMNTYVHHFIPTYIT